MIAKYMPCIIHARRIEYSVRTPYLTTSFVNKYSAIVALEITHIHTSLI